MLKSAVCRTDCYIVNAKDKSCVLATLQEKDLFNIHLSSEAKNENIFIENMPRMYFHVFGVSFKTKRVIHSPNSILKIATCLSLHFKNCFNFFLLVAKESPVLPYLHPNQ